MSERKYVVFNCPAYKGLTKDIPDWIDYTSCGQYTGQVLCQDRTDCVMKQIYEKCKRHADNSSYCGHCSIENLGYLIIDLLQIEEVE